MIRRKLSKISFRRKPLGGSFHKTASPSSDFGEASRKELLASGGSDIEEASTKQLPRAVKRGKLERISFRRKPFGGSVANRASRDRGIAQGEVIRRKLSQISFRRKPLGGSYHKSAPGGGVFLGYNHGCPLSTERMFALILY